MPFKSCSVPHNEPVSRALCCLFWSLYGRVIKGPFSKKKLFLLMMYRNKDVLARMPPFAPPSGRGLTKVHVRYLGENPMGTCVCSQERAKGSQNATARPSGRQLHHTLLTQFHSALPGCLTATLGSTRPRPHHRKMRALPGSRRVQGY